MFQNTKSIQKSNLIMAASSGDLKQLQLILSTQVNRININALNAEEQTALHLACENNKREVVICLVEYGADVNALGLGDSTPLHAAALFADIDIVKYLLENGAKPHLKNKDEDTPIDYAEREGRSPEIVACMRDSLNFNTSYGQAYKR